MPRKSDTKDLYLDRFGLPLTFPPEMLPPEVKVFIDTTPKGLPAADLLAFATAKGFSPLWKPLPHMVEKDIYGLALDVRGLQVPLMAKMERRAAVKTPTPKADVPVRPQNQMSLFS